MLQPAAPAASTATSTAARPTFAVRTLVGAGRAGVILGFLFFGFTFFGNDAGDRSAFERRAGGLALVAGRGTFTCLAGTPASPPSSLAPGAAIRIGVAGALFAGSRFLGQSFGLLGLHFRFDLDVERLFL